MASSLPRICNEPRPLMCFTQENQQESALWTLHFSKGELPAWQPPAESKKLARGRCLKLGFVRALRAVGFEANTT